MAKYISKSAVVAEIERRKSELQSRIAELGTFESNALGLFQDVDLYDEILSFLDTLETKEVASIWNDARKTIPEDSSNQIICIKEDDLAVATIGKLVRGTKKWAYLNDLLNISNVETKDVNLEKEIKDYFDSQPIITRSKGLDYRLIPTGVDIAKHFFELGLKASNSITEVNLELLVRQVIGLYLEAGKHYNSVIEEERKEYGGSDLAIKLFDGVIDAKELSIQYVLDKLKAQKGERIMTQEDKELIKEFCEQHLHTHTDWTGTYVETTYKCDSVDDFVNKLLNYIEEHE